MLLAVWTALVAVLRAGAASGQLGTTMDLFCGRGIVGNTACGNSTLCCRCSRQ